MLAGDYNELSMRNSSFARFAWLTLIYTVAVVLWGAIVRATGSGAGCGETWPLCNGQLVFGTPALARIIEFAHRASSGVDTALIVAMAIWAFRAFPIGHAARMGSIASIVLLVIEALLGAALVKFGLVVNDPSAAHAIVLSIHMSNTLALIGAITLTAWWGGGHPRLRWSGRAWSVLAAIVAIAITGTLAALADTLYPATSFLAGMAQDWSADAAPLIRLRALHPLAAIAGGLWAAYYALPLLRKATIPAITVLCGVCLQLFAGALNLALLTPVWMQIVHLMLADVVWIGAIALCESGAGSWPRMHTNSARRNL